MTPWTDLNEYFITSVTKKSLMYGQETMMYFDSQIRKRDEKLKGQKRSEKIIKYRNDGKRSKQKKLQIPSPYTHINFIIWPCTATYMHGGLCIDSFTTLSGQRCHKLLACRWTFILHHCNNCLGSTFPKTKPVHSWFAVTQKGVCRVLLFPFFRSW